MGVTQNDNNRAAETVTVKNNAITISNEKVQKIVFVDASENNNLLGYFYVGNGYLYAAGGNGNTAKNYLRTESVTDENNNAKAKIEFSNDGPTVTFQGTSTRNIIKFNSSNVPPIFSCYASGQTDIQIYKEVDKPFVLTINPKFTDGNGNYFATISNLGYGNFVVPAGLEVSTITIENRKINKTTSFDKDKVIPGKDVAYYVVASVEDASAADALTFEFEPTTDAVSNNLEGIDNWLYPAIAGEIITAPNSDVDYLFYKLTTKNGKNPGFYWGAADGEPFTFTSEHKAYLAVPQVDDNNAGLSSIAIDDTNGINDIENANEQSDKVYTISGVRVKGNLSKGVYIVNGKKQIVK